MSILRLSAVLMVSFGVVACDSTAPVDPPVPPADAQYTVTLDASWSVMTHPDDFPSNPHFSRLTGATHASGLHLWQVGAPASDGVRDMAEFGGTATLRAEVEALGEQAVYVEGSPLRTSPGTASAAFVATDARPFATVVAMLAPSPDWFVGVDGLDLREGDGWADRVTVDLVVYDAGTADGAGYTAANAPTSSRTAIAVSGYAPLAGSTVGTMTFERTP